MYKYILLCISTDLMTGKVSLELTRLRGLLQNLDIIVNDHYMYHAQMYNIPIDRNYGQ